MCTYKGKDKKPVNKQWKEKDAKSMWKRHKVDKHNRQGKQRSKKASKQARRQTKGGVHKGQI